ncbi:hypothetical protein [Lactococcus taiwanensis]|uniref:hypothetical protein n=1 Tax=Lactococcus taiwanensis TaxID=1151742 RepID=UPI003517A804
MTKILHLFKEKTVVYMSLLTLVLGGLAGYYLGQRQANADSGQNLQQMQNRPSGNGSNRTENNQGAPDVNSGASNNGGGTTDQNSGSVDDNTEGGTTAI